MCDKDVANVPHCDFLPGGKNQLSAVSSSIEELALFGSSRAQIHSSTVLF